MKNILKKIWTELTRVRSIQFVSYMTAEEIEADERIKAKRLELAHERIINELKTKAFLKTGLELPNIMLEAEAQQIMKGANNVY